MPVKKQGNYCYHHHSHHSMCSLWRATITLLDFLLLFLIDLKWWFPTLWVFLRFLECFADRMDSQIPSHQLVSREYLFAIDYRYITVRSGWQPSFGASWSARLSRQSVFIMIRLIAVGMHRKSCATGRLITQPICALPAIANFSAAWQTFDIFFIFVRNYRFRILKFVRLTSFNAASRLKYLNRPCNRRVSGLAQTKQLSSQILSYFTADELQN